MKYSVTKRIAVFLLFCFCVLMVLPFTGCSAKKKSHESDVQKIKIENSENSENSNNSESNVRLDIKTKVDGKSKIISITKKWSPIDATKPASMTDPDGKKHDLNNVVYTEETTTEDKTQNTVHSDNSDVFQKKEAKAKNKSKGKTVAKKALVNEDLSVKGFSSWSWLWMILILLIIAALAYVNNRLNVWKRVTSFFFK